MSKQELTESQVSVIVEDFYFRLHGAKRKGKGEPAKDSVADQNRNFAFIVRPTYDLARQLLMVRKGPRAIEVCSSKHAELEIPFIIAAAFIFRHPQLYSECMKTLNLRKNNHVGPWTFDVADFEKFLSRMRSELPSLTVRTALENAAASGRALDQKGYAWFLAVEKHPEPVPTNATKGARRSEVSPLHDQTNAPSFTYDPLKHRTNDNGEPALATESRHRKRPRFCAGPLNWEGSGGPVLLPSPFAAAGEGLAFQYPFQLAPCSSRDSSANESHCKACQKQFSPPTSDGKWEEQALQCAKCFHHYHFSCMPLSSDFFSQCWCDHCSMKWVCVDQCLNDEEEKEEVFSPIRHRLS
jgi:hypothetical protein